jgi:hypothetical protein
MILPKIPFTPVYRIAYTPQLIVSFAVTALHRRMIAANGQKKIGKSTIVQIVLLSAISLLNGRKPHEIEKKRRKLSRF